MGSGRLAECAAYGERTGLQLAPGGYPAAVLDLDPLDPARSGPQSYTDLGHISTTARLDDGPAGRTTPGQGVTVIVTVWTVPPLPPAIGWVVHPVSW